MSHDVEGRQKDLLNPSQRESLGQHLEQIKTLAPILICSMKIFIQILNQVSNGTVTILFGGSEFIFCSMLQEGKGTDEAIENRNYLAKRMTDEISEVILFLIHHLHLDR